MGATRDANIMGVAIELMAGRALPLIHGCPVPQWHRRGAGRGVRSFATKVLHLLLLLLLVTISHVHLVLLEQ